MLSCSNSATHLLRGQRRACITRLYFDVWRLSLHPAPFRWKRLPGGLLKGTLMKPFPVLPKWFQGETNSRLYRPSQLSPLPVAWNGREATGRPLPNNGNTDILRWMPTIMEHLNQHVNNHKQEKYMTGWNDVSRWHQVIHHGAPNEVKHCFSPLFTWWTRFKLHCDTQRHIGKWNEKGSRYAKNTKHAGGTTQCHWLEKWNINV